MKTKNLFWGIFFIIAAGLIVCNQLGYLIGITLLQLCISILLIPIVIKSFIHVSFPGIFFPLAIFIILFADTLGIPSTLVPWPILAVALLASIGFSILFGKHHKWAEHWNNTHVHDEHFDQVVNVEDDEVVDFGVKFGSSIKYINSKNLKEAKLFCSFGALKVYLDNTVLSEEGAVISLDVSFSGVEIYMPREWKIINQIDASLSGVEEKYSRCERTGPTVKLTGRARLSRNRNNLCVINRVDMLLIGAGRMTCPKYLYKKVTLKYCKHNCLNIK